jgi:hypothetical protein
VHSFVSARDLIQDAFPLLRGSMSWQSTYGIRVLNRQDTIVIRKLHPVTRMRTVCVNIEYHLPSSLAKKHM